jgi:hypothetical protein
MSKGRDCKDVVQVLTGKIEKEVRELKPGGPKENCFVTCCPKGDLCSLKNGGQIIWQQGSGYNNPFKYESYVYYTISTGLYQYRNLKSGRLLCCIMHRISDLLFLGQNTP